MEHPHVRVELLFVRDHPLLESIESPINLFESRINLPESGINLCESRINPVESGITLCESPVNLVESRIRFAPKFCQLLR